MRQLFDQKGNSELILDREFRKSSFNFQKIKLRLHTLSVFSGCSFRKRNELSRTFGKLKIRKKNRASFFDQKNQPEVLVSQKFAKFVSFPENKSPFAYPLSVLGLQFPETKRTLRTFGKLKIRKKNRASFLDQKNQPEVLVSQKFAKFVSFPENKTPFAYPLSVLGLQFPETKRTLRTFGKLKIRKKNRASFLTRKINPKF